MIKTLGQAIKDRNVREPISLHWKTSNGEGAIGMHPVQAVSGPGIRGSGYQSAKIPAAFGADELTVRDGKGQRLVDLGPRFVMTGDVVEVLLTEPVSVPSPDHMALAELSLADAADASSPKWAGAHAQVAAAHSLAGIHHDLALLLARLARLEAKTR
jgi:hypothetical protein